MGRLTLRGAHAGTTGEWGMGLSVHASQRVVIDGVTSRDCWGDGFYVTGASADVTSPFAASSPITTAGRRCRSRASTA